MIDERLMFCTFVLFYERRKFIKQIYLSLELPEKWVYKYYVYSRRELSEKTCDLIWTYINAPEDLSPFFEKELSIENNRHNKKVI